MIQLIASIALMYAVVFAAGVWMVRKQRTNAGGENHG